MGSLRFAKLVFWIAGIWGFLVLVPLYFLFDTVGRQAPPAITHPEFYYGFAGVALAFQVIFLVIAADPVRYRPMMLPSVLEKFSYVAAVGVLYFERRVASSLLFFAGTDLLLGLLFIASFLKTKVAAKITAGV